jgi:uncharacterized glyoxalase superfamily protein PhnB
MSTVYTNETNLSFWLRLRRARTDVDFLFQELKSRGARILNEPKDYPYGMRDFDVNDLDGNQLCFGMESKQQLTTQ